MAELFEAVKGTTEGVLQEKNMELLTECSIDTLPIDFDLMRSALANLVENAKRASSEGQTITLTAHDNVIEVIDHGKGIPKGEIDRRPCMRRFRGLYLRPRGIPCGGEKAQPRH